MRTLRALPLRGLLAAVVLVALAGAPPARPAYADQIVHTVQPGENLFRIGLAHGVSWIDIQQANNLPNTTIYVGQQLVIPQAGAAPILPPADPPADSPADPPANPTPNPQPPAPTSGTYVVQRGDHLSAIARRFGLTTAQLAAANNLFNPSLIYAGQTLVIPGATDAGSLPAPVVPAASKLILVDLSDQRMYVYQDGALMYNFIVSTGSPGRDTRPGTYSVLNKIPNAYASTWNLWMPNWLGIYWAGHLQNGIHALPILSNGLRLWDGYLGTRVSYGCVILGIADAQTLYDWAEVGVPVTIQN